MRHGAWAAAAAALLAAAPLRADVAIGDALRPFTLTDAVGGKAVEVKGATGRKATVLMFIATECPVSNAYNDRMAALARDYEPRGVAIIGVNANREETPARIAEHAREHHFTFPILKDVGNVEADAFGAHVTPEVYVFDAHSKLRYHGRIDDDRSGRRVQSLDLRNALDALLAGKEVPVTETKAFGCTIKRVAKDEPAR